MKKRIMILMLAGIMLLGAASVNADANILFSDDFEKVPKGQKPTAWMTNVTDGTSLGAASVRGVSGQNTNAVVMKNSGTTEVSMSKTALMGEGMFVVEADIMPSAAYDGICMMIYTSGIGFISLLGFKNGNFELLPYLGARSVSAAEPNTWYHAAFAIDGTGGNPVMDFYLDGELLEEDIVLTSFDDGAGIEKFNFQNFNLRIQLRPTSSVSNLELTVDNVLVYESDRPLSREQLSQASSKAVMSLEERLNRSVVISAGKSAAIVKGITIRIDKRNPNIVPVFENDRVMVPLRFISEALGAEVSFDDESGTASVSLNGHTIAMKPGEVSYLCDGETKYMDAVPFVKEDRVFVPVRFFGEALGQNVFWDESGLIAVGSVKDFGEEPKQIDELAEHFRKEDQK